jgi:biotin carboxyl carrier protein
LLHNQKQEAFFIIKKSITFAFYKDKHNKNFILIMSKIEIKNVKETEAVSKTNVETGSVYRQIYIKVNEGQIYAFIPGTILDIFVKKGQKVKKGEPLCTLHAMKMDNNICATIDGKVAAINIKKGQNVSKNDVLIELVASKEK